MSTKDQTLSAAFRGEAVLTARRPELQPLIDYLREVARGRDDIRVECAGIIAGWWFSSPARRGEELIAAGLLMLAGPVDLDELDRWMRIGWERRRGSTIPPGRPAKGLPIWVSPVEQLKTAEANSSEPAEAHSSELAPSETQSPPDRSCSGSNVLRVRNLKSAVQPFHDK